MYVFHTRPWLTSYTHGVMGEYFVLDNGPKHMLFRTSETCINIYTSIECNYWILIEQYPWKCPSYFVSFVCEIVSRWCFLVHGLPATTIVKPLCSEKGIGISLGFLQGCFIEEQINDIIHPISSGRSRGKPTQPKVSLIFFCDWQMMTSSDGNIFRVTGHLCGVFTDHRGIPRTKGSYADLWCFVWSVPE